jgi:hypothetical protein
MGLFNAIMNALESTVTQQANPQQGKRVKGGKKLHECTPCARNAALESAKRSYLGGRK